MNRSRVTSFCVTSLVLFWSTFAQAVTCDEVVFEDTQYAYCDVSADEDLRLWLTGPDGRILGNARAVEETLDGAKLAFAMNAGMFHDTRQPVGLYIEEGQQLTPASDGGGYGNFGLLPNGILCISDRVRVWESDAFAAAEPTCAYASQSGPMLVIGGALHPKLLKESTSRYVRNGVGTNAQGSRAVFVISNSPVNFHSFARFFRDHLNIPDALFLDANVSRLYAPELGRADNGVAVGPIVGVVDGHDSED